MEPLSRAACHVLASTLGDDWPMSVYALRSGTGRAFVRGELPHYQAAVIEELPRELAGFGDPEPLVELLAEVPDWDCVEVDLKTAEAVGASIQESWRASVRLYGSIRYALNDPPRRHSHPSVRELTPDHLSLLRSAGSGIDVDNPEALLHNGIAAGAVIDDRLVAIASSIAMTQRFAEVGVVTLPDFRNRGLSTASAVLLCQLLQGHGMTPVWGTGEDNHPSRRVAVMIGFTETERRSYVIPTRDTAR